MTKEFTGETFEDEVRNIARRLYSNTIGQGSQNNDGRERDGIFRNGQYYTVIEATTDKRKEKALYDAKKTHDLVLKKRQENHMAQGFLVTLHEPTTDQKDVVRKYEKTTKIISFDEFRSQLFDSLEYIRNRSNAPFGSVFDHNSDDFKIPREEFIEPTIERSSDLRKISIDEIRTMIRRGGRFILTAEYGVGKSMLIREIYYGLCDDLRARLTFRTPVVINLRDHLGQDDPTEVLERHARRMGVNPSRLVAAWSAGYIDIFLDGFDELSTRGWTGDVRKLREYRRSTHKVVRDLISQTPLQSAVIIAGRDAYFDSEAEMREALGTRLGRFDHFYVRPFDDIQASAFLKKKGISTELPEWMPTRPLLLNYLIAKQLLTAAVQAGHNGRFARGAAWHSLIEMIADRESRQSEGIDKDSIIRFFGALAVRARQVPGARRSFSPFEMERIFSDLTGYTFVDEDKRLIIRLPGLGISSDDSSNRSFIDDDLMAACSALVEFRFLEHPYRGDEDHEALGQLSEQIGSAGSDVLSSLIDQRQIQDGIIFSAISQAEKSGYSQLSYDIFFSSVQVKGLFGNYNFDGISIDEIDLCQDYFSGAGGIDFTECLIDRLILPSDMGELAKIRFSECLIGTVDGRSNYADLPANIIACTIDQFSDDFSVNNSVLSTAIPIGTRVLIVSLRKIFVQSGKARLESALLRGLDHRAKIVAPSIIESLIRHGFVIESGRQGKRVFSGVRSMRPEALAIIQAPMESTAEIVAESRRISEP